MKANEILKKAISHMESRASTYDAPEGERSMGATVKAFNAITGLSMNEEQGWLFMGILKAVRSQQGDLHVDCYEDGAAYFALAGEAAIDARSKPLDDDGWIEWSGGERPVMGKAIVEVMLRGCKHPSSGRAARWMRWEHLGNSWDIVAYKVIKEQNK